MRKSFDQLNKISEFLVSERGSEFIRARLPKVLPSQFDGGFVISIKTVVITSRNAGMFFSDEDHAIIDYQTLERLLARCDGDVAYLVRMLNTFNEGMEQGYELKESSVKVGAREVVYEGVEVKRLVDFPVNQYRSVGLDKEFYRQFVETNGHPLDVLGLTAEVQVDGTEE